MAAHAALRTVHIGTGEEPATFEVAKKAADARASEALADPVCLSWYDRAEDRESPAHVSECHDACEMQGFEEYALTRGAELKVVVADGDYVFCYRPLGEFAGR